MEDVMRKQFMFLLICLCSLMACGHSQEEPQKAMAAKDTVIGDDIRALEKAKSVQETLNKDKENIDKAIDASSDTKLPLSTD